MKPNTNLWACRPDLTTERFKRDFFMRSLFDFSVYLHAFSMCYSD